MSGDDRAAGAAEIRRLRQQRDSLQLFGQLAVWGRDTATGQGHWDPQLFQFLGA
jgi:hypothetical protein